MSISKGLIIYKASRYQADRREKRKYGCYSTKTSLGLNNLKFSNYRNLGKKYQEKFVQEIHIGFFGRGQEHFSIIKNFSKFRGIKKCSISQTLLQTRDAGSIQSLQSFATRVFKQIFKMLKRIEKLELHNFEQDGFHGLQNTPKIFKTMLLLTGLESLIFQRFVYSEDFKDLQPFMQVARAAVKRRSWPKFKSLRIHSFFPDYLYRNHRYVHSIESLENLLKFMKGLKLDGAIHKCSNFQLALPPCENSSFSEQAGLLQEISENAPSIKSLEITSFDDFSDILEIFKDAKDLQRVSLRPTGILQKKQDLNVLKRVPALQEFKFDSYIGEETDLIIYKDFFTQMQTITNLKSLTFEFRGTPPLTEDLKVEFSGVISSLLKLERLKIIFWMASWQGNDKEKSERFKNLGFEYLFQAIGQRTELRKLSLQFGFFKFEKSSRLFAVFCESLKKLNKLDDLHLDFGFTTLEDEDILRLSRSLCKLTELQDFYCRIDKGLRTFKANTFAVLIDSIANNLALLSKVILSFGKVEVNCQAYQLLFQMAKKLKYLDSMNIWLEGKLDAGLDFEVLNAEINKRMLGRISIS